MILGWRKRAFTVHRETVNAIKEGARKLLGYVPDPALVSPRSFGKKPLRLCMPPMMEEAFGYSGKLRYVEFSLSARTKQIMYSDGGDSLATDGALWLEFMNHPLVGSELRESRYPTLYGKGLELLGTEADCNPGGQWHCLMFDREERRVYVFKKIELAVFFALVEPQEGDEHTVFIDGKLMSPGCEGGKAPPLNPIADLLRWLDVAWSVRQVADELPWEQ